jgi:hypothetical protein
MFFTGGSQGTACEIDLFLLVSSAGGAEKHQ